MAMPSWRLALGGGAATELAPDEEAAGALGAQAKAKLVKARIVTHKRS
jgi:hypothetical protein